jgi:DNA polymerase-1
VTLLDGMKERRTGPAEVEERFGVPPPRVLDLRALVGDPSDNIPGVKGIGAKGAASLIAEWGSLENLLEHADEVAATRARNALRECEGDARLSKELATLRTDVPIPLAWDEAKRAEPDPDRLRELYERLGFTRLLAGLAEGAAPSEPASEIAVDVVADADALEGLIARLRTADCVSLACVFGESGPLAEDVVGFAFATDETSAAYVPIGSDAVELAELARRLEPLFAPDGREEPACDCGAVPGASHSHLGRAGGAGRQGPAGGGDSRGGDGRLGGATSPCGAGAARTTFGTVVGRRTRRPVP